MLTVEHGPLMQTSQFITNILFFVMSQYDKSLTKDCDFWQKNAISQYFEKIMPPQEKIIKWQFFVYRTPKLDILCHFRLQQFGLRAKTSVNFRRGKQAFSLPLKNIL
jgi:hypothetical protein